MAIEDYAELRRQIIEVDEDNDPSPQNTPQTNNTTTTTEIALHWTGVEGIVYLLFASNLNVLGITLTKTS